MEKSSILIPYSVQIAKVFCNLNAVKDSRGGEGVTTIYAGTGCAIFGVPFFEQKISFRVSYLVKSQVVINFGHNFRVNIFNGL